MRGRKFRPWRRGSYSAFAFRAVRQSESVATLSLKGHSRTLAHASETSRDTAAIPGESVAMASRRVLSGHLDSGSLLRNRSSVLVYAVVDDALSPTFPLGDALEVYLRREDAERFIEEVRGDEPESAKTLRIEARELPGGRAELPQTLSRTSRGSESGRTHRHCVDPIRHARKWLYWSAWSKTASTRLA